MIGSHDKANLHHGGSNAAGRKPSAQHSADASISSGLLTIHVGLRRLAVLVPSGTRGFLLFVQTTTDGIRQIGQHHATLSAVMTALLREVRW